VDDPVAGFDASAWSDERLDRARLEGDAPVDELAGQVLAQSDPRVAGGRLGYNELLDLADRLLEAPELYLVDSSSLSRALNRYDPRLRDYFDPQPVPSWVDERLLTRAGELWDEHMLAIIGVLYAASLPSCYLIAKGIPALYATGKLGEHRFIYQRIYETGLMLDAAMRPDGIRLVRDIDQSLGDELVAEYARRDGGGGWRWRGDRLEPHAQSALVAGHEREVARVLRSRVDSAPRWAWGPGVISARKVRFLHASMRWYLLNPPQAPADERKSGLALLSGQGAAYDRARCGLPVNQEDLAYTLLTFGHVIPRGLGLWGISLDADETEAFWHRWRFIGSMMGVRDDLLPRDARAAEALFERILSRQARESTDMGRTLTTALEGFLADYLPPALRRDLPGMLIRSQLGSRAVLILGERRPPLWLRAGYGVAMLGLRVVNPVRRSAARFLPWGMHWLAAIMAEAGQALIASWRDEYDRHPFYVPEDAGAAWHRLRGVTDEFRAQLAAWRSRLFMANVRGLAGLIMAALLLVAAACATPWPRVALTLGAISAVSLIAGVLTLAVWVPILSRRRPVREVYERDHGIVRWRAR
jgi:hypothetical protein